MKNKIFFTIFSLIFILGFFIRFYDLGNIPNSLDWDEVSQAYNAYSILQTGKDDFGNSFPLTIRSLNDYKTPVLTYLSIIPIKIFGLNEFSARFISAFFGTLSIILVFGLVYELLREKKYVKIISFLSMLFFAISPWSIQFSRTSFDANIGVFFVLLASLLFIRGVNKENNKLLFISVLFFGISIYTTHSEKIFSPLFLAFLFIWAKDYFLKNKHIAIYLIIFFLFTNIFWLLNNNSVSRSRGVIFTSQSTNFLNTSISQYLDDLESEDKFNALFHNRRFVYVNKYIENYLSHFNFNNLFLTGDNARHHAPGVGVLYLFSLPFVLLGMVFVSRNKIKNGYLFFIWILIAPIASGFAIDAPNYQRSLIFIPSWQFFEACGWFYVYLFLRKKRFGKILISVLILIMLANIFYYFYNYLNRTNSEYGKYWQYGYKEAVQYAANSNKNTFFANDIEQAYAFFLFYTKTDPNEYILSGGSNRIENKCFSIKNAYFGNCLDSIKKGDLFITSKSSPFLNNKLIKEIYYEKTNESAIKIFEYL